MSRCLSFTLSVFALFVFSTVVRADANDMAKEWQGPADSKDFAMRAAEGGMFEVQSAQLAQQKTSSAEVKSLAQKIQQDHTTANNELMALAKQKNISLPTTLKGQSEEKYQTLQKLDGPTFDQAYISCLLSDHLKDIMMFDKEAKAGTDPDIKQWAAKTVPTLREHLTRIASVAQSIGFPIDALNSAHGEGARPAGSRIQGNNDSNSNPPNTQTPAGQNSGTNSGNSAPGGTPRK